MVAKHNANKSENPNKMDNFLRKYNLLKLTSEEMENLKIDLHRRNREICQELNPKASVQKDFMGQFCFKSLKIKQFYGF